MEREQLELVHADVFTGVGSWPEVASEVGVTPTHACELQPAQRQLLRRRWPRLQLTSDFRRTKFTSWAPSPQQRLWGSASPACQGLTVSGKGALRHYADVRNDQTIMCPAMFRAMGASVACIEQVSELVTLDDTHGMLTSLYSAAVKHGYMPLGAPLYMHSQFGGGTSRRRAVPVMELQHLHEVLPVSHLPSAPPSSVTAAHEWVQAGSRPHLQLQQGLFSFTPAASQRLQPDAPTTVGTLRWGGPGTTLQPGVLCRLHSSPTRLFNIMEHHGDMLLLIQQPRASSCKLWARTSDVNLDSLQVQHTPVKDVMGLASPLRGFGEPPRHTSMLWLTKAADGADIFTWFTPFECWHLSDLEGLPSTPDTLPSKFDTLVELSSVAHAAEAAGQAIPLPVIRPIARWVADRLLQHTAFETSGVHSQVPRLHLDSPAQLWHCVRRSCC